MLLKNLLTLLLAGLTVVTATNSTTNDTSSSSSAAAAGSSSSSSTAGAQSNATAASSSSSAAAATGSSSSSAATTTASSSSSAATTTAGSSSSATQQTTTASSSATQQTTTASSSATQQTTQTAASSSAAQTTTTTGGNVSNTGSPGASYEPPADKIFAVEFSFKLGNIASNVTSGDLMQNTLLVTAVKKSACDAAGLASSKCVLTSMSIVHGRRLGEVRELAAGDATITASVTINAGASAAAKGTFTAVTNLGATLQTNLVLHAVKVGGATPTIDPAQTISLTSAVKAEPTYMNAGSWTLKIYDTADCSGASGADATNTEITDGTISGVHTANCKVSKLHGTDQAIHIAACAAGVEILGKQPGTTCATAAPTAWTGINVAGNACYSTGAGSMKFMKITCTAAAGGGSTSDASSKSIVGVVMGLVMGLIALM